MCDSLTSTNSLKDKGKNLGHDQLIHRLILVICTDDVNDSLIQTVKHSPTQTLINYEKRKAMCSDDVNDSLSQTLIC